MDIYRQRGGNRLLVAPVPTSPSEEPLVHWKVVDRNGDGGPSGISRAADLSDMLVRGGWS